MANHYVNTASDGGGDGTTTALTGANCAFKTIAEVNAHTFAADDFCYFNKGDTWSGSTTNDMLLIDNSGTDGHPITFSSYGTGADPIITCSCTTAGYKKCIGITGDYVIVDGIDATGSSIDGRGINLAVGADHNIVRNCEVSDCANGIWSDGAYNLTTLNYIHDLRFDPTAGYGAQGITVTNSDNEISYNDIRRCRDESVAFGFDGRAIEVYGNNTDNLYVHHNFATENQGFLEIGGPNATYDTNHCANALICYNIATNNYNRILTIHTNIALDTDEPTLISNFRVYNNTFCEPTSVQDFAPMQFSTTGTIPAGAMIMRNNNFYLGKFYYMIDAFRDGYDSAIIHDHNNYYRIYGTATKIGLDDASTDIPTGDIGADPKFVNASGLFNTETDFRLQSDSPCIDAGVDVGLTTDYDGNPIH